MAKDTVLRRWLWSSSVIVATVIAFASAARAANLYVADEANARVVRFKSPFKTGENANLVLGQPDFTSDAENQTASGMSCPYDVLYQKSAKILWVADYCAKRVLGFKAGKHKLTNGQNADIVLGQADFTSSVCGDSASGMCGPTGVTADKTGHLWVVDWTNSRVLRFSPPFASGQSADLVLGQSGFNSDACVTTQDGLCEPESARFDRFGNLWVIDSYNNRVVEYVPPFTTGQNASIVLGQPDFSSAACTTTQSGLCPDAEGGIGVDKKGNVWVGDYDNSRVVEFVRGKSGFTNGQNAAVVIGQSDFASSSCDGTATGLCYPWGIAFDSRGNLIVSDADNNRTLIYKKRKGGFTNGQAAVTALGQPDLSSTTSTTSQSGLDAPLGIIIAGH